MRCRLCRSGPFSLCTALGPSTGQAVHLAHCLHPDRYHHRRADDHVDDDHDGGTDDNHHDHCCADDHDNHDYPAANDDHHHDDSTAPPPPRRLSAHDSRPTTDDRRPRPRRRRRPRQPPLRLRRPRPPRPHAPPRCATGLLPAAPEHLPRQWELRPDVHLSAPIPARRTASASSGTTGSATAVHATSHRLHCTPGRARATANAQAATFVLAVPVPRNKRPQTGLRPRLRRDIAGSKPVSTRMPTTTTTGAWSRCGIAGRV